MADRRVVIITGGAKGIGYACANKFLEDGDNVVIADIDKQAGKTALEKLNADGDRILYTRPAPNTMILFLFMLSLLLTKFTKDFGQRLERYKNKRFKNEALFYLW